MGIYIMNTNKKDVNDYFKWIRNYYKELLKKMLKVGADIGKILALCVALPKEYNKSKVLKWAERYDKIFK